MPPLTETRFVKDQVLLQIRCDVGVPRVEAAVRRFGLTLMAQQNLCSTTGTVALQFHIDQGGTVRDIIRRLAAVQIVAIAQPIYVYALQQDAPSVLYRAGDSRPTEAPPRNTSFEKLHLADVHRIAQGTNVTIAVINSEIDANHPDLAGVDRAALRRAGAPEQAASARHRHGGRHRLASAAARHLRRGAHLRGARLQRHRRPARRAPPSTSSRASTGRPARASASST